MQILISKLKVPDSLNILFIYLFGYINIKCINLQNKRNLEILLN